MHAAASVASVGPPSSSSSSPLGSTVSFPGVGALGDSSTDAAREHAPVATAIERNEVINTFPTDEFLGALRAKPSASKVAKRKSA